MPEHALCSQDLQRYCQYLKEEERAPATLEKYKRDLIAFYKTCANKPICKETVIQYKTTLLQSYAPVSVNSMLAAMNGFLSYMGWYECRVKPVCIQKNTYMSTDRELTRTEYTRLLQAAKQKKTKRLYYLLQTICATGIRVSELPYITVQAVRQDHTQVHNKGKCRTVFLPKALCTQLKTYCKQRGIRAGSVFVTRNGRPLDRSNIWAMMKALCKTARVPAKKVFPHNLRHLFARTFYKVEKDLEHLASILGHSNIDTTRIYVRTSGAEHRRQIERLHLVI